MTVELNGPEVELIVEGILAPRYSSEEAAVVAKGLATKLGRDVRVYKAADGFGDVAYVVAHSTSSRLADARDNGYDVQEVS